MKIIFDLTDEGDISNNLGINVARCHNRHILLTSLAPLDQYHLYIYIYIYIYKCNNKKFCIDAIQQFGGYLLGTKHKIFFLVDGVMRLLCAVIPTSGDMGMLTQE